MKERVWEVGWKSEITGRARERIFIWSETPKEAAMKYFEYVKDEERTIEMIYCVRPLTGWFRPTYEIARFVTMKGDTSWFQVSVSRLSARW